MVSNSSNVYFNSYNIIGVLPHHIFYVIEIFKVGIVV